VDKGGELSNCPSTKGSESEKRTRLTGLGRLLRIFGGERFDGQRDLVPKRKLCQVRGGWQRKPIKRKEKKGGGWWQRNVKKKLGWVTEVE